MGGGLIAASFLVAVLLNRSAREETAPVEPEPPADICEDPTGRRPLGAGRVPDNVVEDCKRATKSLQR